LAKVFSISVPDYGQKGTEGGYENACFWLSLAKLTALVHGLDFKPDSKQVREAMDALRELAGNFVANLTVCAELLKEAAEFALGVETLQDTNVKWSLSAVLWLIARQYVSSEKLEAHRTVFKAVSSKAFGIDEGDSWEAQRFDHKKMPVERATSLLGVIDALINFVDGDVVVSIDAKAPADQRVFLELSEKIPQVQDIWVAAIMTLQPGNMCGNFGVKVADKMMRAARILNIATLVSGDQTGCKLAFHKGFDGSLPTIVVAYQEQPNRHYQPVTHFGESDGLMVIDSMSDMGTCMAQLGGAWKQRIIFRGNTKGKSGVVDANQMATAGKTSTVDVSKSVDDGATDETSGSPPAPKKKNNANSKRRKAKKASLKSTAPSEVEQASQAKVAAEKTAADAKMAAEKAEQERVAATQKWQEVGGRKKSTIGGSVSSASTLPITEAMLYDAIKGSSPAADALKHRVSLALLRKVNSAVIMRALHSRGEFCVLGECCNVTASNCKRKHESNPVSLETVAQGQKQLLQKVQSMESQLSGSPPKAHPVIGRSYASVVSPWTPPTSQPLPHQPAASTELPPPAAAPVVTSNTRDPLIQQLRDLLAGGLIERLYALAC